MEETAIGKNIKLFSIIGVAAIRITSGELKIAETIMVKGHITDVEQDVESLQEDLEMLKRLKLEKCWYQGCRGCERTWYCLSKKAHRLISLLFDDLSKHFMSFNVGYAIKVKFSAFL